jgi:hypothetical protein
MGVFFINVSKLKVGFSLKSAASSWQRAAGSEQRAAGSGQRADADHD